jgi:hypothetical protein
MKLEQAANSELNCNSPSIHSGTLIARLIGSCGEEVNIWGNRFSGLLILLRRDQAVTDPAFGS